MKDAEFVYLGMKEYTSLPDVMSEKIDTVDLNSVKHYESKQINPCIMLTLINFCGCIYICIYIYMQL